MRHLTIQRRPAVLRVGRLAVLPVLSSAEAPLVDSAVSGEVTDDGVTLWTARGWNICPLPRAGTYGLFIGSTARQITPGPPWRLRRWGPFAMRHGGLAHWHPRRILTGPRRVPQPLEGAFCDERPE